MLRTTDFFRKHLPVDYVKLLLIDACLDCECDRITIVYAVEDVDKVVARMGRGNVILWALTNEDTFRFFDSSLDECGMLHLQAIDEQYGIKKMYRIERMSSGYNVVELEFNE